MLRNLNRVSAGLRDQGLKQELCISWMPEEGRFLEGDRLVLSKREGGRF